MLKAKREECGKAGQKRLATAQPDEEKYLFSLPSGLPLNFYGYELISFLSPSQAATWPFFMHNKHKSKRFKVELKLFLM